MTVASASLLLLLFLTAVARADDPTLACADPATIGPGWTSKTIGMSSYETLASAGSLHGAIPYVGIETSVIVVSRGTAMMSYQQENDLTGGKSIRGGPGTCFNASGRGLSPMYDKNIRISVYCPSTSVTDCDIFYSPIVLRFFCLNNSDCASNTVCNNQKCCNPSTLCDSYECAEFGTSDGCGWICPIKTCASGAACGADHKCASSSSALSKAATAGIVTGAVVAFVVVATAVVCAIRRRRLAQSPEGLSTVALQ